MNADATCPVVKPGKESARQCAKGLLIKAMYRDTKKGEETNDEVGYSPAQVEEAIYHAYPSRDTYLHKIAKVALHLSTYTRTGRVSWTFQNGIFNRGFTSIEGKLSSTGSQVRQDDYLEWLLTRARNEEVFPEIYASHGYVSEDDRQRFIANMSLENDAIYKGLQEIVRVCCDSKVCSFSEMSNRYDQELFKAGSVFETAAKSVCMSRKVDTWVPPGNEVYIPDTSPVVSDTSLLGRRKSLYPATEPSNVQVVTKSQDRFIRPSAASRAPPPDENKFPTSSLYPTSKVKMGQVDPSVKALDEHRSKYESQQLNLDIHRNFDVTGQITCFDVSNLIHNLAILETGKLLELPWDGSLLDSGVQEQLYIKYRVEIAMRRYFLDRYYR